MESQCRTMRDLLAEVMTDAVRFCFSSDRNAISPNVLPCPSDCACLVQITPVNIIIEKQAVKHLCHSTSI